MKKVLLIVHGTAFPQSALDFVNQLNEKAPLLLTGFFLPEIVPVENWAAYSSASIGSIDDVVTRQDIMKFEEYCLKHHIEHRVHTGTNELAIPQIIKETRYADILIANDNTFYVEEGEADSDVQLKRVMHEAESAVLVVPDHFRFPGQVMLAYDGSASSVFAIKQFAYLFPELRDLHVHLIYSSTEGSIPDRENIELWCKHHFSNFSIDHVKYDAGDYIGSDFNSEAVMAVTGAYGRSRISEWLHHSFYEDLKKYKILIFATHL